MSWLARQSFLGSKSDNVLSHAKVGIVGLGGGGSHVAQQLAHVGIGSFVLSDPDVIEDSNLNRLVGATSDDVKIQRRKVDIADRVIAGVSSAAHVQRIPSQWLSNRIQS